VPFARYYGPELIEMELGSRPAQRTALRVALLSPSYEAAARTMPAEGREEEFLVALALGEAGSATAPSARARAVAAGFAADTPPVEHTGELVADRRMGEAILLAMELYAHASAGESKDATRALATFRSVGLEDTARRAGLQLLILDRRS